MDLKYIDKPLGCFTDRITKEQQTESIDVIMLTLDSVEFLERCLYTVYREIPIRRLIVCDGGSKDGTVEILKNYPRTEVHVRPDIRTTGKGLEFLISLVETDWFVYVQSDLELSPGWYDEMVKHKSRYDVIENSLRIEAYHFYRKLEVKLEEDCRAYSCCHLINKSAISNYHCDDDYMWRDVDIFLRQIVESSGYRYGKVSGVSHLHHVVEGIWYESDNEKNYTETRFHEPSFVIIDENKAKIWREKYVKSVVKYLDPEHKTLRRNFDDYIRLVRTLDRDWVAKNGSKWLKYYDDQDDKKLFDRSQTTHESKTQNKNMSQKTNTSKMGDNTDTRQQSDLNDNLLSELDKLRRENAQYQKTIEDIHNSLTWRILRKYDSIKEKIFH